MNAGRLVQELEAFNRKERYWVVRNAFDEPNSPTRLSSQFRCDLGRALAVDGLPLAIPEHAWWAIDYHIDWLFGVMFSLNGRTPGSNAEGYVTGNQQDFDFVVAFDNTLILLEAKGVGRWTMEQMNAKWQRLRQLKEATPKDVELHFVSWAPQPPKPEQPEIRHLTLWFDNPEMRFRTINRTTRAGTHWTFREEKKPANH